jgi:hypothetical protein
MSDDAKILIRETEDSVMKKSWLWLLAATVLGFSLSLNGCGEKKRGDDAAEPRLEAVPAPAAVKSPSADTAQPSSGADSSPDAANQRLSFSISVFDP